MKSIFTMNGRDLLTFMDEYIYVSDRLKMYDMYSEKNVLIELYRDNTSEFLNEFIYPNIEIYADVKKIFIVFNESLDPMYRYQRPNTTVYYFINQVAENIFASYMKHRIDNMKKYFELDADRIEYIIANAIAIAYHNSTISRDALSYIYKNEYIRAKVMRIINKED